MYTENSNFTVVHIISEDATAIPTPALLKLKSFPKLNTPVGLYKMSDELETVTRACTY